jgi:thiamine biosynthesis lipoprotein
MTRASITRLFIGLALVLVLGIGGYWRSQHAKSSYNEMEIEHPACWGQTMGTGYSIRITGKVKNSVLKQLTQQIDAELVEVNRQMSTWDPNSEISKFNHTTSTDSITVSEDFAKVVARALEFSKATAGAFDPTLQPLLNLWGFGSEGEEHGIPSDADILAAKASTGWQKISVSLPDRLSKLRPDLSLALGAIAKGYGVDAIARILEDAGFETWFVEIGGEVLVQGHNPEGVPWKIGIQHPGTDPLDDRLQGILHISNGAVATSGDYRNYMEVNGSIYSHILDPRTGCTALSDTASVTVYAPHCTDADAMATSLFVMGAEAGIEWIEKRPNAEAMFLMRADNGAIIERFSSGFTETTGYISVTVRNTGIIEN